jgi:hypothetical protein
VRARCRHSGGASRVLPGGCPRMRRRHPSPEHDHQNYYPVCGETLRDQRNLRFRGWAGGASGPAPPCRRAGPPCRRAGPPCRRAGPPCRRAGPPCGRARLPPVPGRPRVAAAVDLGPCRPGSGHAGIDAVGVVFAKYGLFIPACREGGCPRRGLTGRRPQGTSGETVNIGETTVSISPLAPSS